MLPPFFPPQLLLVSSHVCTPSVVWRSLTRSLAHRLQEEELVWWRNTRRSAVGGVWCQVQAGQEPTRREAATLQDQQKKHNMEGKINNRSDFLKGTVDWWSLETQRQGAGLVPGRWLPLASLAK